MKSSLIVTAVLLVGCASEQQLRANQVAATIYSNPPGATITNGRAVGRAPLTWVWTTNSLISVEVKWPSGAVATQYLNIPMGKHQVFTIQRPNVPGLDIDLKYAVANAQIAAANAQTQRAQSEEINPIAEALRSYNETKARQMQSTAPIVRPTISCTSTARSGSRVDTDCY